MQKVAIPPTIPPNKTGFKWAVLDRIRLKILIKSAGYYVTLDGDGWAWTMKIF
jgi:hypothetical protein